MKKAIRIEISRVPNKFGWEIRASSTAWAVVDVSQHTLHMRTQCEDKFYEELGFAYIERIERLINREVYGDLRIEFGQLIQELLRAHPLPPDLLKKFDSFYKKLGEGDLVVEDGSKQRVIDWLINPARV